MKQRTGDGGGQLNSTESQRNMVEMRESNRPTQAQQIVQTDKIVKEVMEKNSYDWKDSISTTVQGNTED